MKKPQFDVAHFTKLIEEEHHAHAMVKAAEREVEEAKEALKVKELALTTVMRETPRWGMSKASQYASGYIADILAGLVEQSEKEGDA